MIRRLVVALIGLVGLAVVMSGCGFAGVVTLPLPGRPGVGHDSYSFTVQLPDVGTLVPNAQVKVDDIAVGTVTHLDVADWHASATVSMEDSTRIPTDSTAQVGYDSLLGSAYLEIDPGKESPYLGDGGALPLAQGGMYPTTEQVLAATSVLLNGSGLEQVRTIVAELDQALAPTGHGSVASLLPHLDTFVAALDDQRQDIYTAIDGLDRLGRAFRARISTVDTALDHLEPALAVLVRERPHLTRALVSLDHLSTVTHRLIDLSQAGLVTNLRSLRPTLHRLQASGNDVVKGLRYLFTPPFASQSVPNACRGDYCNLFLRLDLSVKGLLENFGGPTDTGPGGGLLSPSQPGLLGLLHRRGGVKHLLGGVKGLLPKDLTKNLGDQLDQLDAVGLDGLDGLLHPNASTGSATTTTKGAHR